MRSLNKKCIVNQDSSADCYSNTFNTDQTFACSAQLIAIGNVLGNFKIQASDDPTEIGFPQNWTDVPETSIAINGSGMYRIRRTEIASQYHRLVFIDTSGGTSTGIITASFYSQGF